MDIIISHPQLMHMNLTNAMDLELYYYPHVYGKNSREDRRSLWDLFQLIGPIQTSPWLIGGDLNEIRSPEERSGLVVYNHGGPAEFIENMVQLLDLLSIGGDFTWTNNSPGPNFPQSK